MNLQLTPRHSQKTYLYDLSPQIISVILDCLDQQQMECFVEAVSKSKEFETIYKIGKLRLAFAQFFNKTDRSYHFGVFGEPSFINSEGRTLSSIALNPTYAKIAQFPNKFNACIVQTSLQVSEPLRKQFGQKLNQLFINPCLPMPKLLRETISTEINSLFQNFLVSQSMNTSNSELVEEVFENLRHTLQQQQQHIMISLMNNQSMANQVRQYPHQITYSNFEQKLLDGNQLHNLIVYLLALSDLFLNGVEEYLKTIENNFDLFLHLTSKYYQFQSTVIGIEQNLGFVFQNYGELHEELFSTKLGKFSFWKPAFAMWIKKMNKFHQTTNPIYSSLLQLNTNEEFEKSFMDKKYQKIFTKTNKNLDQQIKVSSQSYQLMKENEEIETLIHSYQEYLIDISTNENLVHECGHSEQQLDTIFMEAEDTFLEQEQFFINSIKCQTFKNDEKILLQDLINQRLLTLSELVKPRTVSQVIKLYSYQNICTNLLKLETKDKEIDRYLNSINYVKAEIKFESLFKTALDCSDKSQIQTSCSYESDKQIEFYESESEMCMEIQTS